MAPDPRLVAATDSNSPSLAALRLLLQPADGGVFDPISCSGVFPPHTAPGLKIIPVVEGWDGTRWRRYEYRFQLSGRASRPRWAAPHQPRLDYRMFYEGLGLSPDNLLAGSLALHEPYALSHAGFCDRLLQRLLEGDGPVASLFGVNPFAGTRPKLVRMVTIGLEPSGDFRALW